MSKQLRRFVRELLPPVLLRLMDRGVRRDGYGGDYPDWEAARKASTGYDTELILERVKDALLKVKNGEAAYERDSVLFDEVQQSWPLLAALLWIASLNGNRLNIVDFGGSLGSSYFQNRKFLGHLAELRWSVIEQENFVTCGRRDFQDEHLRFYPDLDGCFAQEAPQAILLSSVLPYLEHPHVLLDEVVAREFAFIIIDRTPLIEGERDRLTVQRVSPEIYPASYPAWMLSRKRLLDRFAACCELVAEFDALAGEIDLGGCRAKDTGLVFRKRGPTWG